MSYLLCSHVRSYEILSLILKKKTKLVEHKSVSAHLKKKTDVVLT